MTTKTRYLLYALIVFICVACGGKANRAAKVENEGCKTISFKNFEDKTGSINRVYDQIKYVPLQTTSEALLSDIDKISIHNDTIIVSVDKSNSDTHIFSFDIKGNFIARIGAYGSGPGEYINPTDFLIDGKLSTVEILDAALLKIMKYDFKGNLLQESKIEFHGSPINFIKNNNDTYYFYMSNNTVDGRNSKNLYLVSSKGEIIESFLPIPEQFENLILLYSNNLLNIPSGKFAIPSPSFIVYELSGKNIRERFCFDFGDLMMPIEGLTLETDRDKTEFLNNNEYITGIDRFFILNNILCFAVSYKKRFIYFWYDLDKEHYIMSEYNSDPGIDDVLIKYPYPLTIYKNSLVSWQYAHHLNLENLNDQLGLTDEDQKITDNSNPVLIFAKLKDTIE